MIEKRTWNEFKDNGFLWLINSILHLFGWCICLECDESTKEILNAYPARCKFRGFSEDINTQNYNKLTKYLNENSNELLKDFVMEQD